MELLQSELTRPLNIFYSEPNPDRWLPFDRYPRKLIRRMVRGKTRPGGVQMVALNLMKGLDKLNIPYRLNDYNYIKLHTNEIACIIGKPHLLFERHWQNPIVFGAGIFSHPSDQPDLLERYPNIKRILVPGPWMNDMFKPYYGDKVMSWPTGIDTGQWSPHPANIEKSGDFIIYDKIRWERDKYIPQLLEPILDTLNKQSIKYTIIRYGAYAPADLKNALDKSKAAIFLCEHETQGLAYQQILSANTPVLAWDRGGYWQDPEYYPKAVKYAPVSSVPYWDNRCGRKFSSINNFEENLIAFLEGINTYKPRDYVIENLSLEKCASEYLKIVQSIEADN
jgi:glycosyltransferase involved in cell wall biosynthesis